MTSGAMIRLLLYWSNAIWQKCHVYYHLLSFTNLYY